MRECTCKLHTVELPIVATQVQGKGGLVVSKVQHDVQATMSITCAAMQISTCTQRYADSAFCSHLSSGEV